MVLSTSLSSPSSEGIKLQKFLTGSDECYYYNDQIQTVINEIQNLMTSMDPISRKEAKAGMRCLQHRINTNNHYVAYQKEQNPHFSVCFCTLTKDLVGLKFLLRTGANPNEMEKGKAAIHIAAARGLKKFVAVLKENPQLDINLRTRFGKVATQLACSDEIRTLLENQRLYVE